MGSGLLVFKIVVACALGIACVVKYLFFRARFNLSEFILMTVALAVVLGLFTLWVESEGYIRGDMPRYLGILALCVLWIVGGFTWATHQATEFHIVSKTTRVKLIMAGWLFPGILLGGLHRGFQTRSALLSSVLIFGCGPIGGCLLLYLHSECVKRLKKDAPNNTSRDKPEQ